MQNKARHHDRSIAVSTLYSLDFRGMLDADPSSIEPFQGMNEEEISSLEEEDRIFIRFLVFGTLENRDGMIFGSVGLGSQMRIRFEDGKILLTGELELWEENPARVTPEFSGEKMEAEIEYQDGGGFSLTGVKAADVP